MKSPITIVAVVLIACCVCYAQDVLKVNVETVQVYATVTDDRGRFVHGLKADDFKLSEDGKQQEIDAFTSDDAPISIGILVDVSGTMGDNLEIARQAALTFLRAGNLENEYFLIEFNNKPALAEDYTQDLSRLEKHEFSLRRTPDCGVIDAIHLGLEQLQSAKNPRRVLLVFTSGGSLVQEHKASEARKLARRLDAQIYGMSIVDTRPRSVGDVFDSTQNIMNLVDGESFGTDSAQPFVDAARKVAVGLRNQYIIGYRSTNPLHDGKYRQLSVKLALRDAPPLLVHARTGYYALDEGGRR